MKTNIGVADYNDEFARSVMITEVDAADAFLIVTLAERAEAAFEAEGKVAARKIVTPAINYESVAAASRNGDELTRRKALALLHCWPDRAADDLVYALRQDPCPVVRHEAAYYLATLRLKRTIKPLIEAVTSDPADLVRHEAAEALGDMGYHEAIPALEAALEDKSEMVARTARIALEQLSRM